VVARSGIENVAAGVAHSGECAPGRLRFKSCILQKLPLARVAFSVHSLIELPPLSSSVLKELLVLPIILGLKVNVGHEAQCGRVDADLRPPSSAGPSSKT
jgi:hypothetical protein